MPEPGQSERRVASYRFSFSAACPKGGGYQGRAGRASGSRPAELPPRPLSLAPLAGDAMARPPGAERRDKSRTSKKMSGGRAEFFGSPAIPAARRQRSLTQRRRPRAESEGLPLIVAARDYRRRARGKEAGFGKREPGGQLAGSLPRPVPRPRSIRRGAAGCRHGLEEVGLQDGCSLPRVRKGIRFYPGWADRLPIQEKCRKGRRLRPTRLPDVGTTKKQCLAKLRHHRSCQAVLEADGLPGIAAQRGVKWVAPIPVIRIYAYA